MNNCKHSKRDKKKITFCYHDLEALNEKVQMDFIKSSIFYVVSIIKLELTEYYPEMFEQLRTYNTNSDILEALTSPYNYEKLISLIKEEGGRSDEFIFSVHNQRIILKTITKTDRKLFLSKMLEKYVKRIKDSPDSKLVRILGVFKIKPMNQSLIIMENLLINKNKCTIFDLKGSKVARLVKGIEDPKHPPTGYILKDINFELYGKRIQIHKNYRLHLIETLRMDFEFLRDCGVIDYSILLGIYKEGVNKMELGGYVITADDGTVFCIGIIDIFQEYNFLKAGEKRIKTVFNKKEDISIATPDDYFYRIAEYSEKIFQ